MQETTAAVKEPRIRTLAAAGLLAALVGALFLLPHIVQIALIADWASYSPFSAHSNSAMVWDETFLYGAEANYMLTRGGAPAYDDDWEHRLTPYPYSIIPIGLEALTAKIVGSLKVAHLTFKFIFPAITAFLLMLILLRSGSSKSLAALLALAIIVLAFSPRTLIKANWEFLRHDHNMQLSETLQASRTPNPNVTFPLILLAAICLAEAERKRNHRTGLYWAALAGVLGGLQFYSYIYYAIAWSAGLLLLSLIALIRPALFSRNAWLALAVTGIGATPFLIWKHIAETSGNYADRTARLGTVQGHTLSAEQSKLTLAGVAVALILSWFAWRLIWKQQLRSGESDHSSAKTLLMVFGAFMAGGLIGLDIRIVLGFDVQSAHHFPHMVLQPAAILIASILLAQTVRTWRHLNVLCVVLFVTLFAASAIAQIEAARDSVQQFRVRPEWRVLLDWLNTNTPTASVVATGKLDLNVFLPVSTHNSVLVSDGSRSSATNHELLERYLLASRLSGASIEQVRRQLLSDGDAEVGGSISYSYYLFETSEYVVPGTHHVRADRVTELLHWFSSMDLAEELKRFRVDYVVTDGRNMPAQIPGIRWQNVFQSGSLTVWQLR